MEEKYYKGDYNMTIKERIAQKLNRLFISAMEHTSN